MDKENLEYMECLYEMATVRPLSSLDSFGILLAINPDTHNDDAYFKMYNSTSFYNATTVWRIRFEKAEFIKEHKGKIKSSIVMNSDKLQEDTEECEASDNVVDLFGGSGSTVMACEQTGRNCYMMELDPHYVDVIIARWEQFTGQKAVLLNG